MPQALNLRTTGLFSWSMKCVYHVFTQSVYHVTLDTMRAPTNGAENRNLPLCLVLRHSVRKHRRERPV